jgi:hypothetical protein
MDWHQIAKGWKQLIAKVASPHSAAQELDSGADHSIRAALSGGDRYAEARIAPYIPDIHGERNDSSLHLSC